MLIPRASLSLSSIKNGLEFFQQQLPAFARQDPRISGWSVGQQIEHTTKVTRSALSIAQAEAGAVKETKGGGLISAALLVSGRFPKGRQAPEAVLPTGISAEESRGHIEAALKLVAELQKTAGELDKDTRKFSHPILGPLTKRKWLRFADIHQRHHRRIIERIIAASAP